MQQDDVHWPVNLPTYASLIDSVPATESHFTRQRRQRPSRILAFVLVSSPTISSSHYTATNNNTKKY
jgi:hypothetical protein